MHKIFWLLAHLFKTKPRLPPIWCGITYHRE